MRAPAILSAILLTTTTLPGLAQDVRPAGEQEIATAMAGCWHREPTSLDLRLEEKGRISGYEVCFDPNGDVSTAVFGGTLKWGLEGVGGAGAFRVAENKLHLDGSGDGWFFGAEKLSCDVVVRPEVAMQFRNCTAAGVRLDDTSYAKAAQ